MEITALSSRVPAEDLNSRILMLPNASGTEAEPIAPSGTGVNFRSLFAVVHGNLRIIVATFVITMGLAVAVTLLQSPRYTAVSTIQINNSSSRVLNDKDEQQDGEAISGTDTDRYLKTQVDIIKSRALAARVAERLNLARDAGFYAAERLAPPGLGMSEQQRQARVVGALRRSVAVGLPRDSRVVTIAFESTDPELSASVANAYAGEFIALSLKRRFDSSAYAREFVAGQLGEVKRKLEASEQALNRYARQAGLLRVNGASGGEDRGAAGEAGSVTAASLFQMNQAFVEARNKRIAAEARWQAIRAVPLMRATEVVSNPGIAQLLPLRAQIEAALQEDRTRHLDDYPTVRARQAQLDTVNRQIQAAAIDIRGAVQVDYRAAAQAEDKLNAQVQALKADRLNEQDREVQYRLLAREVDTNRQVYDSLLQRLKDLNASAGISVSNVSIIDAASPPGRPSSPNLARNLGAAFMLALLLSTVIVVIKDQFDDSIRIPEDIESKLGLSLLGVIPRVEGEVARELAEPRSPCAEAYNSLRGALIHATPQGLPPVILVTSAQLAEGKSTSAHAIAVALGRIGKTVLLCDADLRRPSLHRRIGSDNARGLSTLLTSRSPLGAVTTPSGLPQVTLLTSGPIPPSPTELLSGARLREVIEEARATFDVVLIDAPPVLGLADAPAMAALVDGVVFVVEADRSHHGSLKVALRRLRAVNPKLLGGVLTKFEPLRSDNRYASDHSYDHYVYQYD